MTEESKQQNRVDAVRHVGKTLESEGTFLPSGELPENRIETEGLVDARDAGTGNEDEYDREADAMGAERLKTRLPGDTSSDPHDGAEIDVEPARRNTGGGRAA